MSYHNTSLLEPQDCLICRTILGFLTAPLILLVLAAVSVAV
jgi:hypothetical protein